MRGRFIVSLNDRPEVRETFAGFDIEAVETRYAFAGGDKTKKAGELIIEASNDGQIIK